MNPPTIGHEKLLDKLASKAGRNPYRLYLSQSQDPKKNPLSYKEKVKFVRKMFPRHARNVMINRNIRTAIEAAVQLYNEGFRQIVLVVGSDRIREFDVLLNKYNGKKARHGFYNFESIRVISAGDRDPDADDVSGMSASKMRSAAADNDFTTFAQGLPKNFSNKDSKDLFNAVRRGMGLKEQKDFKNHIKLQSVSEVRESYVDGKLYSEGDTVVVKETGELAKVKTLGSNYVIIESTGNTYRKWLDAVERVEEPQVEYETAPFSMSLNEDNTKSMYKDKPDWGTDASRKKAKKMTPGEEVKEEDPCWPGYRQVGTKKKNGKIVPNCVKEKIEVSQDKDIDELPGSQPASFQKGIKSKSTKAARHRHFKRMSKRDDDDKSAYKDAPGDKAARKKGTKPSQYTKKYKQMYGEEKQDPIDIAKQRIDREKKMDAKKHDNILDRARIRAAKQKNRETK